MISVMLALVLLSSKFFFKVAGLSGTFLKQFCCNYCYVSIIILWSSFHTTPTQKVTAFYWPSRAARCMEMASQSLASHIATSRYLNDGVTCNK